MQPLQSGQPAQPGASYKVLICGLGRVTGELLDTLGDAWQVTLLDKDPAAVERAEPLFMNVLGAHVDDASSPVVLERVGIGKHDYVLALTDDDEVNLLICKTAKEKQVKHISALVYSRDMLPRFSELGVHVLQASSLLAKIIYHYLQDPRIYVTPLILGSAAVFEINASDHFRVVGKRARHFSDKNHRLVGLMRKNELRFPRDNTVIKGDDTMILLGRPQTFQQVCGLLDCGNPHFPLAYGQNLLMALPGMEDEELNKAMFKAQFLTRNIKVKGLTLLCGEYGCEERVKNREWGMQVKTASKGKDETVVQRLRTLYADGNFGLVAVPPLESSFFERAFRAPNISLAHDLDCPLLLMRYTAPWERILVPFNGTPRAEQALGVAVDIARQLGSTISVVLVEQPEFLNDPEEREMHEAALSRLRELAHIHKTQFEEIQRKGNPVREIVPLTKDFDLLVLGSTRREGSVLAPNVGELLARRAACSVLLLTN